MRKTIFYCCILLAAYSKHSYSQSPEKFSYQSILRNAAGNLLANQAVGLRLSILDGALTVFAETHSTSSDANGLISVIVGDGTPETGTISAIDWGAGTFSIRSETDPAGGTTYTIIQETSITSVPFSLFSGTAGISLGGDYNNLINKPAAITGNETSITAGTNITVSGTGTNADPYEISSTVVPGSYAHYIGELYQGGIVVAVWKEGAVEKGLIASLTNLGNVAWSDVSVAIGATAQSPINGQSNTNAMLAQSSTAPAAVLCNDYTNPDTGTGVYSDWYLPSHWELYQVYRNATIINEVVGDTDGLSFGAYWCSTEYNAANAFHYDMAYGNCTFFGKPSLNLVRAMRRY